MYPTTTRPYLLHALSPLHAGTGQAVDIIDLPISRMRATGIPFVPGSSIKGVLREARRAQGCVDVDAIFGPLRAASGPAGDSSAIDFAGALIVGDARLLALPVRSFRGTFAFTTSPLLLHLAHRDLKGVAKLPEPMEAMQGRRALVTSLGDAIVHNKKIYLEDLDLDVSEAPGVGKWADFIAGALPKEERPLVTDRFVVVDDETMAFLWETATQVDTRIRIDDSGTVADGALWTEESLPPETLLLGVLAAQRSMKQGSALSADDVLRRALPGEEILQFGGKATVGRGRSRIVPWAPEVAR